MHKRTKKVHLPDTGEAASDQRQPCGWRYGLAGFFRLSDKPPAPRRCLRWTGTAKMLRLASLPPDRLVSVDNWKQLDGTGLISCTNPGIQKTMVDANAGISTTEVDYF